MSDLRTIDLSVIEELVDFLRGAGYVLDFSDRTFSEFFAEELNVDIDHPQYATGGSSKGKRLRTFLKQVDNRTAAKTLKAIWEHREHIISRGGREDPVRNAEGRYFALLERLGARSASPTGAPPQEAFNIYTFVNLRQQLIALSQQQPQARGYAFEKFLKAAFDAFGMKAKDAFRNTGEQIDGSFSLGNDIYLLEAKWQNQLVGAEPLHGFHGKLDQKASWARGLFVSYCGFSDVGLEAFGKGKRIVCMDGLDFSDAFDRQLPLDRVIERKVRAAAETGKPFVRTRDLFS